MRRPTHRVRIRLTAALLAVTVLWLAPASAFGSMPSGHPCAMPPAPGGVVSPVAPPAGTSCQHLERFGCPMGACGASAVVQPTRVDAAGDAPLVTLAIPAVVALPSGPRSAPPTPPPNG